MGVFHVASIWLLILICTESRQTFITQVGLHSSISFFYTNNYDVQPQIELQAIHKQGLMDIQLSHHIFHAQRHFVQIVKKDDTGSLSTISGLSYKDSIFVLFLVLNELLPFTREHKCWGRKTKSFRIQMSCQIHHFLENIFSAQYDRIWVSADAPGIFLDEIM